MTVAVTPVVDLTADNGAGTTAEDTALTASVVGTDATTSGGSLSYAKASDPAHGTVVVNATTGAYTYTPTADYNGPDAFTYTVTDPASGESLTRTINLTVTPFVDIDNDLSVLTNEDTPVVIDVNANDSFENTGHLITEINGLPITAGGVAVSVANGTVSLGTDGKLTFTPAPNYNGPATSFTYTVLSGGSTETATVTVAVTPVVDAPVAVNDNFVANGNMPVVIPVRGNDSDPDDDAITVTQINGQPIGVGGPGVSVNGGVVTLNSAGDLVFTPNTGFNGTPSFNYTISDPSGLTSTANVTSSTAISGTPAPLAVPDVFATRGDAPVVIDVLGNDFNATGGALAISAINGVPIAIGGPGVPVTGGLVTLDASGRLRFTPTPGSSLASTTFSYTLLDSSGRTSTANVTLLRDPAAPLAPNATPIAKGSTSTDDGGIDDTARSPVPPRAVITTVPALHVTASVAGARAEGALRGQVDLLPVDAATLSELTRANGGSNNDLIPVDSSDDRPALIERHTNLFRENVLNPQDTLFVQHAVRYEDVVPEYAQFVHHAVISSQSEARANALRTARLNSAVPGVITLADPFAIGSPEWLAAQRNSDAARTVAGEARSDATREGQPTTPRPGHHNAGADSAPPTADKPGTAPGFSAQLQRSAANFRARAPGSSLGSRTAAGGPLAGPATGPTR